MSSNNWVRRSRSVLAAMGLAVSSAIAFIGGAHADDPDFVTVGVGYYDLRNADSATEFRLEYRSDKKLWFLKPFAGAMGTSDKSYYFYGGLLTDIYLGNRFVLTPNFAAGYYEKGDGKDLGSEIEFRSSLDLAYRFDNRARLGVSVYHMSNASIGDKNPGTEVVSLVFSWPLGPGN